jgi:hypothetical protein
MSAISRLFRANKASPRAVDENNQSLIHHLVQDVSPDPSPSRSYQPRSLIFHSRYYRRNGGPHGSRVKANPLVVRCLRFSNA